MLVKQFKNSGKEIYFNKASDLYQQLTSLGSIFQRTTFSLIIQSTFPWMLLIIYTSSAIFVYPLVKSLDRKNRIRKQFSLKLLVRKFLLLESVQRFYRDLLSNHKEERKSAEILSNSTIVILQLCFLGIFNLNQKAKSCTNGNFFRR